MQPQSLTVVRHLAQLFEGYTPTPRGKAKDKRTETSTIKAWLLDFRLFSRLRGKGELKEVPACYLFRKMLVLYLVQKGIAPQDLLSADELEYFSDGLTAFDSELNPPVESADQTVAA